MITARLPTYIPLENAAERYGIELADLEVAVERGLIRAVAAANGGDAPQVLVAEEDVEALANLEELPELPVDLPRYVPLAAELQHHPPQALTRLLRRGRIRAITGEGGVLVVERRQRQSRTRKPKKQPLEQTGERRKQAEEEARRIRSKYEHLKGRPIGVAEAGRKYGIPQSTVSKWMHRNYIKKIGQDGQKILLDEADVAYCAEVYRSRKGEGRRWMFDKDGLPYILKGRREEEE